MVKTKREALTVTRLINEVLVAQLSVIPKLVYITKLVYID